MHCDGYVFEPGDLVVANGTTCAGLVVRREQLGAHDGMFVYDVCWTAAYAGVYGCGWTPCEISPVDAAERAAWESHYPSHADSPWHSCVSCAVRAMAEL